MQDDAPPSSIVPLKAGFARAAKPALSRRQLIAGGIGLIGLSASATGAYASTVEPSDLLVTPYAVTPPNWPAGRKLTITVIADLHAGGPHITLPQVARIVDTANALQSDIIVLLGDFKAFYSFPIKPIDDPLWGAELARLYAPLGVWAILGNHDWWHDLHGVRSALAGARIPMLENDARLLGAPGQQFWLAGLGDQEAHWLGRGRFRGIDDLPGTLKQVRTDDPVVLLAHEPDIFTRVPPRVSLTLSGHTHGGQIRVPLIWPHFVPSRYGARFAYGHIVENGRHMIVSGGLGTSVIPARLGVPPEILHVTLGA
ncbi:MAG TPA: metallophosphoesterase [Xanthobacteraceae bacterium]|nr:metallophosphoesterase [Xanthobacteraceae bacterium]